MARHTLAIDGQSGKGYEEVHMGFTTVRVESRACAHVKTGKVCVGLKVLEAQKLCGVIHPNNLVALKMVQRPRLALVVAIG